MAIEAKPQTDAQAEIPGTWIDGEFYPYFLSPEETQAEFDAMAQEYFGIDGEEFIRRLDAGEYDDIYDDPAHPELMNLSLFANVFR